jgi:hypothetical protein
MCVQSVEKDKWPRVVMTLEKNFIIIADIEIGKQAVIGNVESDLHHIKEVLTEVKGSNQVSISFSRRQMTHIPQHLHIYFFNKFIKI